MGFEHLLKDALGGCAAAEKWTLGNHGELWGTMGNHEESWGTMGNDGERWGLSTY